MITSERNLEIFWDRMGWGNDVRSNNAAAICDIQEKNRNSLERAIGYLKNLSKPANEAFPMSGGICEFSNQVSTPHSVVPRVSIHLYPMFHNQKLFTRN